MLNIYAKGFGLHQPYQFLLDPSFCLASLRHKFDPKERLAFILGAPVRLFVTTCVMQALRLAARSSVDPVVTGAPFVARRLELRRCHHDEPCSVAQCFQSLIGKENPFHYGVAADDEQVKASIRQVAGVPLVYVERVFPLLEPPTNLTLATLAKQEASKQGLSTIEAKIIQKQFGDAKEPEIIPKHKRKRAKGPNPLSVKKSGKAAVICTSEGGKKKRQRRKKAKTSPSIDS